jgi:hypothetical protein
MLMFAVEALLAAIVVALIAVYVYGNRVKQGLEARTPLSQPDGPLSLSVSEESAAALSKLSVEPIFLKQSGDGTRVQIDNRPLVPVAILTDEVAGAALREVAVSICERYGHTWTVLVSTGDEGAVSVQRLS